MLSSALDSLFATGLYLVSNNVARIGSFVSHCSDQVASILGYVFVGLCL